MSTPWLESPSSLKPSRRLSSASQFTGSESIWGDVACCLPYGSIQTKLMNRNSSTVLCQGVTASPSIFLIMEHERKCIEDKDVEEKASNRSQARMIQHADLCHIYLHLHRALKPQIRPDSIFSHKDIDSDYNKGHRGARGENLDHVNEPGSFWMQ